MRADEIARIRRKRHGETIVPFFIGSGAPFLQRTLAYPDLRQGSRSHPKELSIRCLVTGKCNVALEGPFCRGSMRTISIHGGL